jgi:hypothetical protein
MGLPSAIKLSSLKKSRLVHESGLSAAASQIPPSTV